MSIRNTRKVAAVLVVIVNIEEENDALHLGIDTIEIDGDDFIVESVIAILVAFKIVAGMVQCPIKRGQFAIGQSHVVVSETIERRPNVVDGLAFGIEHEATQVNVNIDCRFEESEESAAHNGSPITTNTEVGQSFATLFFQIDGAAFFKIDAHSSIYLYLSTRN